jgi:hypothetical protein
MIIIITVHSLFQTCPHSLLNIKVIQTRELLGSVPSTPFSSCSGCVENPKHNHRFLVNTSISLTKTLFLDLKLVYNYLFDIKVQAQVDNLELW